MPIATWEGGGPRARCQSRFPESALRVLAHSRISSNRQYSQGQTAVLYIGQGHVSGVDCSNARLLRSSSFTEVLGDPGLVVAGAAAGTVRLRAEEAREEPGLVGEDDAGTGLDRLHDAARPQLPPD